MNLAISNIAWDGKYDSIVFEWMRQYGFTGLEIAPTRIFMSDPYDHLKQAKYWAMELKRKHGFVIPSMQSIWYGRTENIFSTDRERNLLLNYTKKAIDFAEILGCRNLVFGCPKNRNIPQGSDDNGAVEFFREIGEYADCHHTVIALEANPPIYHTNYINDTLSAIELIEEVNCDGFRLNLDVGTMIQNDEWVGELAGKVKYINHVHVSEPQLVLIQKRAVHRELAELLQKEGYCGYVSIEMSRRDQLSEIQDTLQYVAHKFENIQR